VHCDEGFYHTVARQMLRSGDFWHLDFAGEPRLYDTFMNAPLQYWARAALIAALGDGAWSMRILSATMGLATVLLTWRLARAVAGPAAALLAGLLLLTNLQFVYWHSARTGELETTLSFLLALAAACFTRALEQGRPFWRHHAVLLVLLNVKSPVVAIPLLAETAFFATDRAARVRFAPWALSFLAVLPLGLAWHFGQAVAQADEALAVAAKMLGQAVGLDPQVARREAGPLVNLTAYAGVASFGAYPHVAVYVPALLSGLRRAPGTLLRVLALYVAALIVFYATVAKHLPWYIVPVHPLLSVFAGIWLERLWREIPGRATLLAACAVLALALWVGLPAPDFNPFANSAWNRAPERALRALPGPASAALGAAGVAGAALVAARLGRTRLVGRTLVVALLALGLARVLAPLAHLGYVSPTEELYHRIERDRLAGRPIETPIPLPERTGCIATYYFGDAFRFERAEVGGRRRLTLVPR